MEVDEEEKEAGTGNEGKRVKTAIENEREEEEEEKWCLLQTQRGLGQPRKASNSGSHRYNASIKHSLPK